MSLALAQSLYEAASKVSPTVTPRTTSYTLASQAPSGLVAASDLTKFMTTSTTAFSSSSAESNRFLPASASSAASSVIVNNEKIHHNPLALGLGLGLGMGCAILALVALYFVMRARRDEKERHARRASQMGLKQMSPGHDKYGQEAAQAGPYAREAPADNKWMSSV